MTPLLTGVFASQISGHLDTWAPTSAYDALGTVTVPSGGLSSITFAGIPQTGYTHLQLRVISRGSGSETDYNGMRIRVNGDSGSNYYFHEVYGTGSAAGAYAPGSAVSYLDDSGTVAGGGNTANVYGASIVDILDYANTNKYKVSRSLSGMDSNNSNGFMRFSSGLWKNTAAINSLQIFYSAGTVNFAEYSQFALYGVK